MGAAIIFFEKQLERGVLEVLAERDREMPQATESREWGFVDLGWEPSEGICGSKEGLDVAESRYKTQSPLIGSSERGGAGNLWFVGHDESRRHRVPACHAEHLGDCRPSFVRLVQTCDVETSAEESTAARSVAGSIVGQRGRDDREGLLLEACDSAKRHHGGSSGECSCRQRQADAEQLAGQQDFSMHERHANAEEFRSLVRSGGTETALWAAVNAFKKSNWRVGTR